MQGDRRRQYARYLLALVRVVNGGVGLFAPQLFIRRFEPGREPSAAAIYAFRLFGIRTILIGLDLLGDRSDVQRTVRQGVLIHASDLVTVATLGLQRKVSTSTATTTALISAVNVILAVSALEPRDREHRR